MLVSHLHSLTSFDAKMNGATHHLMPMCAIKSTLLRVHPLSFTTVGHSPQPRSLSETKRPKTQNNATTTAQRAISASPWVLSKNAYSSAVSFSLSNLPQIRPKRNLSLLASPHDTPHTLPTPWSKMREHQSRQAGKQASGQAGKQASRQAGRASHLPDLEKWPAPMSHLNQSSCSPTL